MLSLHRHCNKKLKIFSGMTDSQLMVDLDRLKSEYKIDKWLDLAIALLRITANWKKEGQSFTADELFEQQPDLKWMGNILELSGFLRPTLASEGAFPYQITLKGLILYDLISDVVMVATVNNQNQPCERAMLPKEETYKMIFQLLQ